MPPYLAPRYGAGCRSCCQFQESWLHMQDELGKQCSVVAAYTACTPRLSSARVWATVCCVPALQVTVDVPWSPYDIDGRSFDWQGLAAAADLLFIMLYDTQSQVSPALLTGTADRQPWQGPVLSAHTPGEGQPCSALTFCC